MTAKNKLRNNLIRKIQHLPVDKLTEITNLIGKLENPFQPKEKTLKLAGTWKDLGDDFFTDLTQNLHENRAKDRQIN
ncbi:MAG: hypothetical protein HOP30_17300 [Cyclobacteriaceae bacterium]|nr:hypothetical protein [Cyclobacteriaceae bacterium]